MEKRAAWMPTTLGQTLEEMRNEMNRLFNLGNSSAQAKGYATSRVLWTPPVDVSETTDEFVVTAELPGIDQKNVTINLENNVLSIRGERKFEEEKKEASYHLVERSYGVFQRSFGLPNNVQADRISAQMKDGVLTVHLPKREESKPRTIDVTAG